MACKREDSYFSFEDALVGEDLGSRHGSRQHYAVIEAAFESIICDDTLGDIWAWLEEVTTGSVKRREPNRWKTCWPATTRDTRTPWRLCSMVSSVALV
jgi:hypothetical protein